MDVTGAGTAIMIAIAAALWFAYFLPTWMRRREYLDTERTATRLQQTLRVMAETAELPDQVRVEVTARDAARQERLLRAEQRRADAVNAQAVAGIRILRPAAMPAAPPAAMSLAPHSAARPLGAQVLRRRRAHRLATLLMVAATVTIVAQGSLIMTTGAVPASWLVLGAGAALGVVGIRIRRRVDGRGARAASAATPRATAASVAPAASAPERRTAAWTPVAVPKPLYLGRPDAQLVAPAADLATQLRAAALASERELRVAHEAPEVVPFRPTRRSAPDVMEAPTARPASPSRWAAMGRMDQTAGGGSATPDLDEVLRRRRTAG